jgi:hypothetical protein
MALMTWVRFDDQFPIHRKMAGLADVLYRLHTEAIFWCARNTTDGVISTVDLAHISPRGKLKNVAFLVEKALWHEAKSLCAQCKDALAEAGTPEPAEGWVIHDYLSFQPSRSKVVRERSAKAERQARWVASKTNQRRSRDASQTASIDTSQDAATRARARGQETPPRPAPKEAGRGAGRDEENPDWRTLPAAGTARDPQDVERNRRGLQLVRNQIRPKEAS